MRRLIKFSFFLGLLALSSQFNNIREQLVDNYVRKEIVEITNEAGNSGGTGFHIKAPSGKTYILTNAHICDHVGKDGSLFVSEDEQRPIPRKIIEVSKETDLCLVESLPNHKGLTVAGSEDFRSDVEVIGHPQLLPSTPYHGQLTGTMKITVMDHIINPGDENDKCDLPKNKIIDYFIFGIFPVKVCSTFLDANSSNITILPGNSGSPLVSKFGRVEGVAFAGNSSSNWGFFITLKDIKEFLKPY